ncbi:Calx-beta domain-containing protein [Thalassoroseus pseudoceratinae]|uniref:Calx-beta domain-containing protein n=1 Tax=Thalassoroseus pseudoceratinae TaxID=2713176 RepID=UPI0036F2F2FE
MISIGDATITEGGILSFDVTITNPVDVAVTLDADTQDGAATLADSDYTALVADPVNFAPESTTTFTVMVQSTADAKVELDETLSVMLSNLNAGGRDVSISGDTGQGTIENDDSATISINDIMMAEGDGGGTTPFVFTVTLDAAVDANVSVDFNTTSGSAVTPDDYATNAGTLTFPANSPPNSTMMITVDVVADELLELDETFQVALSGLIANGRTVSIADGIGVATIQNDDNDIILTGTGMDDILEIIATGRDSGTYQLFTGGTPNPQTPNPVPFTGIDSVDFDGLGGSDILRITNPAGDYFHPTGGIIYEGGTGGTAENDTLEILGGTVTSLQFDYTNDNDGFVSYDGTQSITYTGLEPITSTINATNVILNYNNAAAENITVVDNGNGTLTVDSGAAEVTTFDKPSGLLDINAGTNDTVTFQGGNTIGLGAANLNVDAGTVVVTQNVTTTGNATLTARTGGITDNTDDGNANLTATNITLEVLTAGSDIGGSMGGDRFELDADVLEINSVGSQDYFILDTAGGLQVVDSSAGGTGVFDLRVVDGDLTGVTGGPGDVRGNVVIVEVTGAGQIGTNSSNALEINALTRFDATSAGGDIYARDINTDLPVGVVNAGAGHVELTVPGGSITDADTDANDITAASAILLASNNVGSGSNFLDTTVGQLEGRAGGAGGFWVENTGDLEVGGILSGQGTTTNGVTTEGGNISIYVESGNLTISEIVDSNRNGTMNGGNIALETGVAPPMGGDITIAAPVLSGGGTVTAEAEGNIIFTAVGLIDVETGGATVTLLADADTTGGGGITMADGSVVNARGGDIDLDATDDILLASLISIGGNVTLDSTGGSILDNGDGVAQIAPIDDGDAGYSAPGFASSTVPGFNGDTEFSFAGSGNTATWTFSGLTPGLYQVAASWGDNANRASNAPYSISSGGAPINVTANQKVPAQGDVVVSGTNFEFLGGPINVGPAGTLTVQLTDVGANGVVSADAVLLQQFLADVTADTLIARANGSVGTSGNAIDSDVGNLEGSAAVDGFFLENTGNLTIGGINGVTGVSSGGSSVVIQNAGSVDVTENVSADADIEIVSLALAGSQTITVIPGVTVGAGNNVTLQSSDDLDLQDSSTVQAGGQIFLFGDFGDGDASGANINLFGTLASDDSVGGVMVTGGGDDDTITLNPSVMHSADSALLDGQGGDDTYHIFFGRLNGVDNAVSVVEAGPAMANNDQVILEGRDVDEVFDVLGQNGGTVRAVGETPMTNETVTYSLGVEQLSIFANGGEDGDTLNVEPSQTATIFVDGGSPGFGPGPDDVPARSGDTLNFDSLGNTFAIQGKTILTDGGTPMPFKGVTFFGIENLPLDPLGSDVGKFDFDKTSNGDVAITQAGYTSVPQNQIYVETDPVGTRFGWLDMPGELNDFDLGAGTTANFDDVFRDGHGGNGPNTFRADVATNGWYLVSAKLGDGTALDDIQIRNGDTGQILIEEIDSLAGESVAVTFAVLVEDNTLDITFDDLGGLAFFSVNGLEFRPGNLLTFGSPDPAIQVVPNSPTDPIDAVDVGDGDEPFLSDGRTVRYFNGYNATANSVVTVTAMLDSDADGLDGLPDLDVTVLASLDIDPDVAGVQVQADANGEFQYAIVSPSGRGTVFIKMEELSGDQTGCIALDFVSPTDRLFDFNATLASPTQIPAADPTDGTAGDPADDAYHGVLPTEIFEPGTGYGWVGGSGIGGYDRGPQAETVQGELRQDAHQSNVDQVFRVELAPGTYTVNVTVGDSTTARPNVEVSANGVVVLPDLDAAAGEFVTGTFEVTIGPAGVLDLNFGLSAPASFWVVNGLEIRSMQEGIVNTNVVRGNGNDQADGSTIDQITGQTATPPADGEMYLTVTTDVGVLVNDASAAYAGHQVFVDAAGNFTIDIRRPSSNMDVTATVDVLAVDGSVADSTTIDFTAFAGAPPRRFDFNQGASGLTAADFTAVAHNNLFNGDFGWQTTVAPFDFFAANSATPLLRRDGARGSAPGTFQVSADIGTDYDLRVYVGSRFVPTQVQVSVEGGAFTATSAAVGGNTFTTVTLLGVSDQNADGIIDIALSGVGGSWWVNGLDIAESASGLPPAAPLTFAGEAGDGAATVSASALETIATAAITRLAAAGEDVSGLAGVEFQITDLNDQHALGLAGSRVILIDDDGFGHGWFVDQTPLVDEEFTLVTGSELSATHAAAADQVDLLTVVMHELGHILGYGDLDAATNPNELMTGELGLGTRRLPSPTANADADSSTESTSASDSGVNASEPAAVGFEANTNDGIDGSESAPVDDESWTTSDSPENTPTDPAESTEELRDTVFAALLETAKTKTPWDLFETPTL